MPWPQLSTACCSVNCIDGETRRKRYNSHDSRRNRVRPGPVRGWKPVPAVDLADKEGREPENFCNVFKYGSSIITL